MKSFNKVKYYIYKGNDVADNEVYLYKEDNGYWYTRFHYETEWILEEIGVVELDKKYMEEITEAEAFLELI